MCLINMSLKLKSFIFQFHFHLNWSQKGVLQSFACLMLVYIMYLMIISVFLPVHTEHSPAWGTHINAGRQIQSSTVQGQHLHLSDITGNTSLRVSHREETLQRLIEIPGVSLSAGLITSTRGWTAASACVSSMEEIHHQPPDRVSKHWGLRVRTTTIVYLSGECQTPLIIVSLVATGSAKRQITFDVWR